MIGHEAHPLAMAPSGHCVDASGRRMNSAHGTGLGIGSRVSACSHATRPSDPHGRAGLQQLGDPSRHRQNDGDGFALPALFDRFVHKGGQAAPALFASFRNGAFR